jgi:hypothetical protein
MNLQEIADALAEASYDSRIFALTDRDINCLARSVETLLAQAWRAGAVANDCPNCSNEPAPNPYRKKDQ